MKAIYLGRMYKILGCYLMKEKSFSHFGHVRHVWFSLDIVTDLVKPKDSQHGLIYVIFLIYWDGEGVADQSRQKSSKLIRPRNLT